MEKTYTIIHGKSPLIGAAIHDGHLTRPELNGLFQLNDAERLREEDPFTARWVDFTDNQVIVHHSRFETDVNRSRDLAVYVRPKDAWGLEVWKDVLPIEVYDRSLEKYDQFYEDIQRYFDQLVMEHERLVVYDIHSYNYRREGRNKAADEAENPEVNIGTKNMDREEWDAVVNALMTSFRKFDYQGRFLDVRENIKFKGGYFGKWLYERFGERICPISIEFKKFFMDEWTGEPFDTDINLIRSMLHQSTQPVLTALHALKI